MGCGSDDCSWSLVDDLWGEASRKWTLEECEEVCDKLGDLDEEDHEALFFYLKNGHFNLAYIGEYEESYIGKYTTNEECAFGLNQNLVDLLESAGYTVNVIDEYYLAQEHGADYSFEASNGGVYCFRNV